MIREIFDQLYDIGDNIYDLYKNKQFNDAINFTIKENNIYNNIDIDNLLDLYEDVVKIEEEAKVNDYDNYELLLYGCKSVLITRRIYLKLQKFICNSIEYKEDIRTAAKLENNFLYVCPNFNNSLVDLCNRIYSNIEIKFLYFCDINNKLSEKNKNSISRKMMFMNCYIEDKFLNANEENKIEDFIKKEDDLRNNLWENITSYYDEVIKEYALGSINKNIKLMLSDFDLYDNINIEIRKIYLRTLFNYLDEGTLSDINYNYRNSKHKIYNVKGEELITEAFREINKDKQIIKQIKTR